MSWIDILISIALIAVVVTLVAGVLNMLRGGEGRSERSNIFMRWRVGLQFLAIALLLVGFWLKSRAG